MVLGDGEKTTQKKEMLLLEKFVQLFVLVRVPPPQIWTNLTGWQTLHVAGHHNSPPWTSPGDYSSPEWQQILEESGCYVAVCP